MVKLLSPLLVADFIYIFFFTASYHQLFISVCCRLFVFMFETWHLFATSASSVTIYGHDGVSSRSIDLQARARFSEKLHDIANLAACE
jgi:hypothetical protein